MNRLVVALGCVLVVAGCDSVTSENIQRWKGTQKGPGKLQEAVKSSAVAPRLRAEAAAALVDINMVDESEAAVAAAPPTERSEIVKTLIPIYSAGLANPDLAKARTARDALFGVRQYAGGPEEQRAIDAAVLPSLERDLREGRTTSGRHSMDKMLEAMGPAAGPMLVKLLQDPKVPYQGVVDLLQRVGDDASRQAGAEALVKRAATMPEIPVPVWRAIGSVGGKTAIDFLVQRVNKGGKDAVLAAQALQQRREPSVLAVALRVAGDQKADKQLRDEMFGVIEKIGGPEAQRGLCSIIAADPTELVRYRAYEAALAVGQGNAVVPALEAFPQKATYKRDDIADFLAKDITKLGAAARPAALKALGSTSPVARLAGVMSLDPAVAARPADAFGTAADAPTLLKLASDKGTLKGLPAGDTVGKEAARVAAVLQKKR